MCWATSTSTITSGSLVSDGLTPRTVTLTAVAMCAFAANSLLCRVALTRTTIDASSFTLVRIAAGAITLALLVRLSGRGSAVRAGTWPGAIALFVYAAGFSFAYQGVTTGTGALLLFGAVQATMISVGLARGERFRAIQLGGLALAYAGLIALLLPGVSAPPVVPALLMITAGVAWGAYSLLGRGAGDATLVTAGNFVRAVPLALALGLIFSSARRIDRDGVLLAIASGALASGVGYAIWYTALRSLRATAAATVQLSVPVIAALSAIPLLGEAPSLRLILAGTAILGGVAIVLRNPAPVRAQPGV